jgi:hypothetical protein
MAKKKTEGAAKSERKDKPKTKGAQGATTRPGTKIPAFVRNA